MFNYSTGDYFIDYKGDLIEILQIRFAKVDKISADVKNISDNSVTSCWLYFDYSKFANAYVIKYLGKLTKKQLKSAQILYSKGYYEKRIIGTPDTDDCIVEWKTSRKNS